MKQENTFSTAEFQDSYSEDGFFSKISDVFKKAGVKVVYMALLLYYVLIALLLVGVFSSIRT